MSELETAPHEDHPADGPKADALSARVEGDWTVCSAAGVDLAKRSAKSPERYTLLRDFPRWGWKAGEVKALSAPDDEHMQTTARELAAAL